MLEGRLIFDMTQIVNSYLVWHYGDNLIHLNFLRRLAVLHQDIRFVHYCDPNQHAQLRPVIEDIPNIRLSADALPPGAVNAWINFGANHGPGGWDGKGFLDRHPMRWDYVQFHLDFFDGLAKRMGGFESPIKTPFDMLFDCPCIQKSHASNLDFDVLVINSRPGSGQLRCYTHPYCMDLLIDRLARKGHRIAATAPTNVPGVFQTAAHNLTLVDIANLSLRTPYIVGVSTGPLWLTHSTFNLNTVKYRVVLLERQRVHLPGNGCHAENIDAAVEILQKQGII